MTNSTIDPLLKYGSSSVQLTQACLDRVQARDEEVGAFLTLDASGAQDAAHRADATRAAGLAGLLCGIPVAIKDNINVEGLRTTCGSKFLENFISPYDATVTSRLKSAGAVLLGKTNLDEFAMGSSTEFSALRTTRNPIHPEYVAGGSSGGSAAAVAAGMAPLALGSSTGGSIRQPAAFCGVVGMKPSYGRVSRYGLVAYGSSLDQIGPLAKDVEGAARLLQVIAGHDPLDATSSPLPVPDYLSDLDTPLPGLRIGLPREYMGEAMSDSVRAALQDLIARFRAAGAQIVELSLPHTEYAIPAYYLIATAEASSNLARFDGIRYSKRASDSSLRDMYIQSRSEGFGIEVKRRILLGTFCLSSGYYEGYYLRAQKVRTKIVEDFQAAFTQCDILLTPTSPTTAFRLGSKIDDPMEMYLMDIYTVTANMAGIPAISIPAGRDGNGLPIGMQLLGPHFEEARLLRTARQAERLLLD